MRKLDATPLKTRLSVGTQFVLGDFISFSVTKEELGALPRTERAVNGEIFHYKQNANKATMSCNLRLETIFMRNYAKI